MATKIQEKKRGTAKADNKKAPATKTTTKKNESIGFLRAAERAHIAVMDIPLDFFADLGMFPEKVQSTKALSRRFIGGMYKNLDSVSTKINNTVTAPAKLMRALTAKLQKEAMTDKAAVKPKARAGKPKAKPARAKAKPATKSKAAAPKAKATPAAPKSAKPKEKSKAKAAKPKAQAKAAKKAVVKVADMPNPTGIH